jgi:predicted phage tail protein
MPGELLYLKATGGPITLATGGNIYLGGPSSMVVPQNQTVILRRTDTGSTAWLLHSLSRVHDAVSADNGDAAATLTVATSEITQVWNTPLTADRAVTLSTTGAYNGAVFKIVRTAAATGAYNLNVGTGPLKALAAGTWCEVKYDGSAWILTAYGAL